MYRNLVLLWLALSIAIASIAVLGWISASRRAESQLIRTNEVLRQRLLPFRNDVAKVLDGYSIQMQRLSNDLTSRRPIPFSQLKQHVLVHQLVAIDSQKRVLYPETPSSLSTFQLNELRDALEVLQEFNSQTAGEADVSKSSQQASKSEIILQKQSQRVVSQSSSRTANLAGWIAWFHNRSLLLGYQTPLPDGGNLLIILPRGRWIADVIGQLPEENSSSTFQDYEAEFAYKLVDTTGRPIYQWGSRTALAAMSNSTLPTVSVPLQAPLEYWQLQCFATELGRESIEGQSSRWPYFMGIGSLALLLIGLGVAISYSLNAAMLHAARRVSFVNQVSHELKTPLTNVVLYCDLLERDLERIDDPEQTSVAATRLDTIQAESRRLQFLIDNVLQFARRSKSEQRLITRSTIPDKVVLQSLSHLTPRLQLSGIETETKLNASKPAMLDERVVQQIVDNLLSNVEKYASSGNWLCIATHQDQNILRIQISDRGPGIPSHMRERIFEPFVRLDNSLEAAAGTGIGLSIVRTLARLHGGECAVRVEDSVTTFEVTLTADLVR